MRLIDIHLGARLFHPRSLLLWVLLWLIAAAHVRADRIILRNSDFISGKTVVQFDEDGVRLDDGTAVEWQDIEQAQVSADKQAAFDKLLRELGDPLFRIRQRLRVGDYRDLSPHAEALYPRYVGRGSSTAYMVLQATMWSRLAHGQREAALAPYVHCFQHVRGKRPGEIMLPGDRRLEFDPRTGMCPALSPVWFDAAAAKAALPEVAKAAAGIEQRPDGLLVYYATLALAAGDVERAERSLAAIRPGIAEIDELTAIVAAQREVLAGRPDVATARLDAQLDQISPPNRPLALYWVGTARLAHADAAERQRGLLRLLRIPAEYGSGHGELAAAALFRAMQELKQLDDVRGSVALRNELLVRYGQTYFATRVNTPLPADPSEEAP